MPTYIVVVKATILYFALATQHSSYNVHSQFTSYKYTVLIFIIYYCNTLCNLNHLTDQTPLVPIS